MALQFVSVESDDQIDTLAKLADEIWHEYWPDIITKEQTDYMVEKFLSPAALKEQIDKDGFEYFFMNDATGNVGFIGLQPQKDADKLFLSKLYLLQSARGKGYASEAFEFLEGICRDRDLDAIWLTVNKNNKHAIDVYKVKGFETIRTQTKDIGDDYVMDDFIMEKPVD